MLFGSDLFYGMFNNLAIFIVMVFAYGLFIAAFPQDSSPRGRLILGLCFGVFALIAMHARIPASEGVIVDQRNAITALSGAFGGPVSAVVTAVMAGSYRIYLGGSGALSGAVGVGLGAIAGIGMYYLRVPRRGVGAIAAGALASTHVILPGFLVYIDLATGWALLKAVYLPFGTAIFLGIFFGTLLLSREQRRHAVETALKASEDRFRDFAESASDWFWETDARHRLAFISTGTGEKAAGAFDLIAEVGGPDEAEDRRRLLDIMETRADFRGFLYRRVRAEGEIRFLSISGKPMTGRRGTFLGYRGTATDVTEQVAADARLREREERYRSVIATAQDGFWATDMAGRLIEVNDAYVRRSGYSRDALLSMSIADIEVMDSPAEVAARIAALRKERTAFFATRHRARDGEVWDVEASVSCVDIEGGRLFCFLRDISERTAMERQLVQAQKMEAVGQLSGGIAHDFNNLLNVVSLNAGLLQMAVADNPGAQKFVDATMASVSRGAELTRKLLSFARAEMHDTRRVSVNQFVRGMEGLIARSLTPAIRVETALAEDVWPVDINPGDFEDAILNLALNARDAMPAGGTLVIETANKVIDDGYVQRNPGGRAGDFVMIAVSDTGTGMSRAVLDKAFEPFFTTKEEGRGSGLGLSMVYGFVRRSGGHAKIYSEVGQGTTVRLHLPRAEGEAGSAGPDAATAEPPRGTETILVVDDEAALVQSAEAILASLGYATLAAANGPQALAVLDAHPEVDLLFSDVIMPGGMDGYRLAIAARSRRPDLRILLTTGFTRRRETLANGDGRLIARLTETLLGKPYNAAELAFAVRRALDG